MTYEFLVSSAIGVLVAGALCYASGVALMAVSGTPFLITLTGGAIGQGLPSAIGAAIACPERPVLALIGKDEGDSVEVVTPGSWQREPIAGLPANATTVIVDADELSIAREAPPAVADEPAAAAPAVAAAPVAVLNAPTA